MFDATNGRQAINTKIDGLTDRFAAEFEDRMSDLSLSDQEALVERLVQVMSSTDTARGFAINNAGQPAQALGSGTQNGGTEPSVTPPTPNDLQSALDTIIASNATDGQKAALTRIFFSSPNSIAVEDDGTPSELLSTRTQRDNERTAKETAIKELREERDAAKAGSLAKQLEDAKAANTATTTPATPADMVAKADVKKLLEADEFKKLSGIKQSILGGNNATIKDADASEIKATHDKLVQLVS